MNRSERWDSLDRFLERWFPEAPSEPGVSSPHLRRAEQRLGLALPPAFCEWYGRFGARSDVWSVQDQLLMPDELRVEGDVLIFCRENQDVVQWGIRLDDLKVEDPPVVVSDQHGGATWFVESSTTSAFAAHFALLNVKFSDGLSFGANGQGTDEVFAAIKQRYARLPFPDLHWPESTSFYGNDDLIIENNADTWIWASARSEASLAQLDAIARAGGMVWELYNGE